MKVNKSLSIFKIAKVKFSKMDKTSKFLAACKKLKKANGGDWKYFIILCVYKCIYENLYVLR